VCGLLQESVGIVLEPSDQKDQSFSSACSALVVFS
jgi:hypothetical protein